MVEKKVRTSIEDGVRIIKISGFHVRRQKPEVVPITMITYSRNREPQIEPLYPQQHKEEMTVY